MCARRRQAKIQASFVVSFPGSVQIEFFERYSLCLLLGQNPDRRTHDDVVASLHSVSVTKDQLRSGAFLLRWRFCFWRSAGLGGPFGEVCSELPNLFSQVSNFGAEPSVIIGFYVLVWFNRCGIAGVSIIEWAGPEDWRCEENSAMDEAASKHERPTGKERTDEETMNPRIVCKGHTRRNGYVAWCKTASSKRPHRGGTTTAPLCLARKSHDRSHQGDARKQALHNNYFTADRGRQ